MENQVHLKVTRASDIQPRRQQWLYKPGDEGVIPLQTGTVFAGMGGEGKSSFAIHLAALLSRGQLEGDLMGYKGRTIIFGPEDDWHTAMVPRLMAAGADLDRIFKVTAEAYTPYGMQERELKSPLDIFGLESVVAANDVKLIIIDPISTSMTGDLNKVQDVRDALGALTALAQKYNLAVIAINHFNKSGTSVSSRMSGSHAIRDVVRSYLAFATDDETNERIITQDKSNYSTSNGSWKFALESTLVQTDDGPTEVPAVRMLGASDVSVRDIIDREHNGDNEDDDRNAAEAFILAYLQDCDGWEAKAGEVIKAGRAEGFTENQIKNARKRAKNPRIRSESPVVGAGWIWRIDESPSDQGVTKNVKESQGVKESDMTPSDTLEKNRAQGVKGSVHDTFDTLDTLDTLREPADTLTCDLHDTTLFPGCYTCSKIAKQKTA